MHYLLNWPTVNYLWVMHDLFTWPNVTYLVNHAWSIDLTYYDLPCESCMTYLIYILWPILWVMHDLLTWPTLTYLWVMHNLVTWPTVAYIWVMSDLFAWPTVTYLLGTVKESCVWRVPIHGQVRAVLRTDRRIGHLRGAPSTLVAHLTWISSPQD